MLDNLDFHDSPVFSYAIASGDMRYIEIGKRDIHLRLNPDGILVFQGEILGCRPGCFIDLSEILLEFATSCAGCREQSVATHEAVQFGDRLADILVAKINQDLASLSTIHKLSRLFKHILTSMNVACSEEFKDDKLEFSLEFCPLNERAKTTGLTCYIEFAHVAFTALCKQSITALAPDWFLLQPDQKDFDTPISKIIVARK